MDFCCEIYAACETSEDEMGQTEQQGIPVIAFAGYSGSGKTTLIEALIPLPAAAGTAGGGDKARRPPL